MNLQELADFNDKLDGDYYFESRESGEFTKILSKFFKSDAVSMSFDYEGSGVRIERGVDEFRLRLDGVYKGTITTDPISVIKILKDVR